MGKEKFEAAQPTAQAVTQSLHDAGSQVQSQLTGLLASGAQLDSALHTIGERVAQAPGGLATVRVAIMGLGLAALCWAASARGVLRSTRQAVVQARPTRRRR